MSEKLGKDFSISLTFDEKKFKEVERYLKKYPRQMLQHIAESMNRAVNTMNTEVRRGIAKRYNLTQGQIKGHTSVHKAIARKLTASVVVSDSEKRAWHLYDFKVNPRTPNQRLRRLLRVGVLRGGRMVELQHAFVARMKSGHEGVFEREPGAGRLKIKELFSPTPAIMASQSVIAEEVEAKGYETFEKRIDHALNRMADIRGKFR
jgi:hypothetical protein